MQTRLIYRGNGHVFAPKAMKMIMDKFTSGMKTMTKTSRIIIILKVADILRKAQHSLQMMAESSQVHGSI